MPALITMLITFLCLLTAEENQIAYSEQGWNMMDSHHNAHINKIIICAS